VQPPACDEFLRGTDVGAPAAKPALRAYLEAARTHLLGLHDAGAAGRTVNETHADLIDPLVRLLFKAGEQRWFATAPRLGSQRMAVLAVGGYGRRELALGSDIDLLFLHPGKMSPYVETVIETVVGRLIDAGLVLGHATRNLAECMRLGRQDLPTLTSYLDARSVAGDPELAEQLEVEVRSYVRKNALAFAEGKLAEQQRRHEQMGESPLLLQPNLKESVGGLRDYHTALWVARAARWEVRVPEQLRVHGFVGGEDLRDLLAALDFLWRLRNELQRGGRKDDRLHYAAQERLAAFLGLQDTPELLAVEQLMRQYYLHVRDIGRVSRRVQDHALRQLDLRRARIRPSAHLVEDGFAIVDGKLEIPRAELLEERPLRLLSAFAVTQRHDVDLSPEACSLLHRHLHLIDDGFRRDPEAAALLRRILNSPQRVYRALRAMNELEILGAYIPEFQHLFGLWQQDLYHTYTVDAHSLFLVEQLRRTRKGRYRDELPIASELMREMDEPFALYLGCLLHDIGKGLGGNHCPVGADMIPEIAKRLHLTPEEQDTVHFVTLHHLFASYMADRRDVNDPATIRNLARLCQTRERLKILYLATVADIRSVSKEAFTRLKHGQLMALYRNTMEWLEASADEADPSRILLERAAARAQATQSAALAAVAVEGGDRAQAEQLLESMPPRYLLSHDAAEIALHLRFALDYTAAPREVGLYSYRPVEGRFWGLVVLAPDQPGLFSRVAGALADCGHNVRGASVYTARDGLALESYQLDPIAGGPMEEAANRQMIERRVRSALAGQPLAPLRRRVSDAPAGTVRQVAPSVIVDNQESDLYTVIDITAQDRPALLYDITRTLAELGLDIAVSRASTRANEAVDSFYVTERGPGGKKVPEERQEEVRRALLAAIA
jgi:[protein-PII] uridylyltransferase